MSQSRRRAELIRELRRGLSMSDPSIATVQKLLRLESLAGLTAFAREHADAGTELGRRAIAATEAMTGPWRELAGVRAQLTEFGARFEQALADGSAADTVGALEGLARTWPAFAIWMRQQPGLEKSPLLQPAAEPLRSVLVEYARVFYAPFFKVSGLRERQGQDAAAMTAGFWNALTPRNERLFFDYCDLLCFESNERLLDHVAIRANDRVLDIGAGSKLLLSQLLERQAAEASALDSVARGFDEPGVTQLVGSFLEVGPRLAGVPDPARFDVIFLSWILHDWPDAQAELILRKAARSLAPGGRILILEQLRPDGGLRPDSTLDLLVYLHAGGQERTESEYRSLLARAGLALDSITRGLGNRDLLEARATP